MNDELKPHRGAPFGNQNARKHGFYSRALSKQQRQALRRAAAIKGINEEIALLQSKLYTALTSETPDGRFIKQLIVTMANLMRLKQQLDGDIVEILSPSIAGILAGASFPSGTDSLDGSR